MILKKCVLVLLALVLSVSVLRAGEKKSLLIMVDGLRSDALFGCPTPNIDKLINETWASGYHCSWTYHGRAIPDAYPVSEPNHVSIATGVTSQKSRVGLGCALEFFPFGHGMGIRAALPKADIPEYDLRVKDADYKNWPTYLERIKKARPQTKTAWFFCWGGDAGMKTNADFCLYGKDDEGHPDLYLLKKSEQLLAGTLPDTQGDFRTSWHGGDDIDCLMLYLGAMDSVGHRNRFSIRNEEYAKMTSVYDQRIGRLLDAIKNRPNFKREDWQIVIVSDHGGLFSGHGFSQSTGDKNSMTIPFVVTSRDVASGRMIGTPMNCVAANYVLQHMLGSVPEGLDDKIYETRKDPAPDPDRNMLAYFPLNGNINDTMKNVKAKPGPDKFKFVNDGIRGKCIRFENCNQYLMLDKKNLPKEGENFSLVFWFRTDKKQDWDAPLFGNVILLQPHRNGFFIAANKYVPGNLANLDLGDGGSNRAEIGVLEYNPDKKWYFFAMTVDRKENAVFYIGDQEGRLSFVASSAVDLKKMQTNENDWGVGQDGLGRSPKSVKGDFDEIRIWNRALLAEEIRTVYLKTLGK